MCIRDSVIDDAPVAGLYHFHAKLTYAAEHSGQLKVKAVLPEIVRGIHDGIEGAAARVVYQDIDLPESVYRRLYRVLYVVEFTDVTLYGEASYTLGSDFLCDSLQLVCAPGKQDNVRALARKGKRKLASQAA